MSESATILVLYLVPVSYSLYWSARTGLGSLTGGERSSPAVSETESGHAAVQETPQTAAPFS